MEESLLALLGTGDGGVGSGTGVGVGVDSVALLLGEDHFVVTESDL